MTLERGIRVRESLDNKLGVTTVVSESRVSVYCYSNCNQSQESDFCNEYGEDAYVVVTWAKVNGSAQEVKKRVEDALGIQSQKFISSLKELNEESAYHIITDFDRWGVNIVKTCTNLNIDLENKERCFGAALIVSPVEIYPFN